MLALSASTFILYLLIFLCKQVILLSPVYLHDTYLHVP